jgi:hypothetical protein
MPRKGGKKVCCFSWFSSIMRICKWNRALYGLELCFLVGLRNLLEMQTLRVDLRSPGSAQQPLLDPDQGCGWTAGEASCYQVMKDPNEEHRQGPRWGSSRRNSQCHQTDRGVPRACGESPLPIPPGWVFFPLVLESRGGAWYVYFRTKYLFDVENFPYILLSARTPIQILQGGRVFMAVFYNYLFFFFYGTWVWTQGLKMASPLRLDSLHSPLLFSYFCASAWASVRPIS